MLEVVSDPVLICGLRGGVELDALVGGPRRRVRDGGALAVEALLLLARSGARRRDVHALDDVRAELEVAGSLAALHARKTLQTAVHVLLEKLFDIHQYNSPPTTCTATYNGGVHIATGCDALERHRDHPAVPPDRVGLDIARERDCDEKACQKRGEGEEQLHCVLNCCMLFWLCVFRV